jgi:hypothetical protein
MSLILFAAPASAVTGAHIHHYAPDDGYDTGIIIRCAGEQDIIHPVLEGRSSYDYCNDVAAIYVYMDDEIWCKYSTGWEKKMDAQGWHIISDSFNDGYGCTHRTD